MSGRLSLLAAARVVARRDFAAVLLSRAFVFFLLGPLFPVVVAMMAGGVGERMQRSAETPTIGIAMTAADTARTEQAAARLRAEAGLPLPPLRAFPASPADAPADPATLLRAGDAGVIAVLSGTPASPVLSGPAGFLDDWRRPVALLAAEAAGEGPRAYPAVTLRPVAETPVSDRRGRLLTAQGAQTLLFLLTMLLAGMVLSNLVEEKGNKVIEILAAAIPMDAVFLGKLFAMLGISFVGIMVWGGAGALVFAAGGEAVASRLPDIATPAVGWPMMVLLGTAYFAMAYMLLGSLFLSIGSMATTVREVQTISMPVTMMQLMVFFLASFAMTQPGTAIEWAALAIPFSSPFAMIARAAQSPALMPHLLALAYQTVWVAVLVKAGAALFRTRVMKSGPARTKRRWARGRKA